MNQKNKKKFKNNLWSIFLSPNLEFQVVFDKVMLLCLKSTQLVLVGSDFLPHHWGCVPTKPLPLASQLAALLSVIVQEATQVTQLLLWRSCVLTICTSCFLFISSKSIQLFIYLYLSTPEWLLLLIWTNSTMTIHWRNIQVILCRKGAGSSVKTMLKNKSPLFAPPNIVQ